MRERVTQAEPNAAIVRMFGERFGVVRAIFSNRAAFEPELHGLFQFFVRFREGIDREFQIFTRVRGAYLNANARGAMRDDGIEKADHVNAFLEHARGELHPIVPIMIGDAAKSQKLAARMLEKGDYVIGLCYPVLPRRTPRARVQVSAAHSRD